MFKKLIALFVLFSAANLLMADFKALEQEYRKLYKEKKLDECIAKCEEAFQEAGSERDKWETFFYRYNSYMRLKKYDEAIKMAAEAQKMPKYAWRGSILQIQCLMRQHKYEEALTALKQEDTKDWPDNAKVQYYWEVGNANLYGRNYDEALKNYEQGMALTSKTYWKINFIRQTGNALLRKKEFDKAIEKYKEALALPGLDDNAKCDMYNSIGKAYDSQKKYAEAVEAYLEGAKCANAHGRRVPNSLVQAARSLIISGDNDKALELYKQALKHEKCDAGLKKYIESRIDKLEK